MSAMPKTSQDEFKRAESRRVSEANQRRKERGEVRVVPPAFWTTKELAAAAKADAKRSTEKLRARYSK